MRPHLPFLGGLLLLTLATFSWFASRGMMPQDEGMSLATALRVSQGEWPHKDFHDLYTGGRSWYQGLLLHLFHPSLVQLRWALLPWDLVLTAALYLLALRLDLSRGVSFLLCTLLLGWRLPLNFQLFTSFYPLVCWGVALALLVVRLPELRSVTSGPSRGETATWFRLGAAGFLVFFFKQSLGIFFVMAAVLLVLDRYGDQEFGLPPRTTRWGRRFAAAACALALLILFRHHLTGKYLIVFLAPPVLAWTALERSRSPLPGEPTTTGRRALGSLLLGLGLPLAFLAGGYASRDAAFSLGHGVFVRPQLHLLTSLWPLREITGSGGAALLLFLSPLFLGGRSFPRLRRGIVAVCWLTALFLFQRGGFTHGFFDGSWQWTTYLVPLAVSWYSLRFPPVSLAQRATLLFAPFLYLVLYPMSCDAYLAYALPLGWLVWWSLGRRTLSASPWGYRAFLGSQALLLAIPFGFLARRSVLQNDTPVPAPPLFQGLYLPAPQVREMEELALLIQHQTAPGETIFAYPDCADLPLWAERPTFSPHLWSGTLTTREDLETILAELDQRRPRLLIYATQRRNDPEQRRRFEQFLRSRYHESGAVGPYEVYLLADEAPRPTLR